MHFLESGTPERPAGRRRARQAASARSRASMQGQGSAIPKLSSELWQVDWDRHLPHPIDGGQQRLIVRGDARECLECSRAHAGELYGSAAHEDAFESTASAARDRYYERAGDFLAFREGGALVGFLVGTPLDWDSYYLRYACVLPDARCAGWV